MVLYAFIATALTILVGIVLIMLHNRMVVLERIVTDRGYSLHDEIEALRDKPAKSDAGVPLDIRTGEKA